MKFILTNLIIPFIIVTTLGCDLNENEQKNNLAKSHDSLTSSTSNINQEELTEESIENYYTTCYSNVHSVNGEASIKSGFAGIYKGQRYYYETWIFPNAPADNIFYLFLRTDTTSLDTQDFCFCSLPIPENMPEDSVVFRKLDKYSNEWRHDSNMTIEKFPSNFQPLIFSLIGYYMLFNINENGVDDAKIYFKGENLYLEFWDYPRYGDNNLLRWTFKNDGKRFKFEKESILKTVKNDN